MAVRSSVFLSARQAYSVTLKTEYKSFRDHVSLHPRLLNVDVLKSFITTLVLKLFQCTAAKKSALSNIHIYAQFPALQNLKGSTRREGGLS